MQFELRQQLVDLLRTHTDEIIDGWIERVHELGDSHYQQLQPQEMRSLAHYAVQALTLGLETGTLETIDPVLAEISLLRVQQGFQIGEVIQGLLLTSEAIFPILDAGFAQRQLLKEAARELDRILHWIVGRFAQIYADALNQSLMQQQKHTALMLQVAQLTSGSLELDHVLQQVVQFVADVMSVPYCWIYLRRDHLLVPYTGTVNLNGTVLETAQQNPLDVNSEPLLHQVLTSGRPAACNLLDVAQIRQALGIKTALMAPIQNNRQTLGLVIAATPDEQRVFSQDQMDLLHGLTNACALAIDNARLYDETRQRLAETESVQQVTTALLMKVNHTEALQTVCAEAQLLTRAQGSFVLLLEDDGWLRPVFQMGEIHLPEERLMVAGSPFEAVFHQEAALLVNDVPENVQGVQSLLAAQFSIQNQPAGILALYNRPGGFRPEDLHVIDLLAGQTALALESTRLHREVERLAVMEERQRLARELHDSVTQDLYGLTLYVEAASRLLRAGNVDDTQHYLSELRQTAQEALREMRLLIFELRPPILEKEGLLAALQARLEAVEGRAGLQTEFHAEGDVHLPPGAEESVYRIAQEALNNALKHAQAHKISLNLTQSADEFCMRVCDDGQGFDLKSGQGNGGLGLQTMRERSQRMGALLTVQTQPGRGTCWQLRLPLMDWKEESRSMETNGYESQD